MKHIRLFLSVLILILMFVPGQAQDIDSKVFYRLSVGTKDKLALSMYASSNQGDYAVAAYEPSEAVSQLWRFVDVGDGFFRLINASQPNMSLDVVNDSITNDRLVLAKTEDVLGQQWKLSPDANGFRLTNRWQAGKSIEATLDVNSVDSGSVGLAKTAGNTLGQMWTLNKTTVEVGQQLFELTSTALENGVRIDDKYTGEGEDISPPLAWKGAPAGTKSFILICEDRDAPSREMPRPEGPFVHWVIYNIPANTKELPAGVAREEKPSRVKGARQGLNDFDEIGYAGPMPPKGSGKHRYFFKIYAIDRVLDLDPRLATKAAINAQGGKLLGTAELMVTYEIFASSIQDSRLVWQRGSALFRRARTHGEDYGISRLKLLELGVDRRELFNAVKDWSER